MLYPHKTGVDSKARQNHPLRPQQCLLITTPNSQTSEHFQHVERLWLVNTLPYRDKKEVKRRKQDQKVVELLKDKTVRIEVEGELCHPSAPQRKMSSFQSLKG